MRLRPTVRRVAIALTVGVVLLLPACARRRAEESTADRAVDRSPAAGAPVVDERTVERLEPIAVDSVRGIVRLIGPDPGYLFLQREGRGSMDIMGSDQAALRAADGLEVTLFGQVGPESGVTPASAGFVVTRFAVRAVDGIAAIDGHLERSGEGFTLRFADGSAAPLSAVPEPLRSRLGARIYWAGSLDAAPRAYGVLVLPRAP